MIIWTGVKWVLLSVMAAGLFLLSGCGVARGLTKDLHDTSGFILKHTRPTDEISWWQRN